MIEIVLACAVICVLYYAVRFVWSHAQVALQSHKIVRQAAAQRRWQLAQKEAASRHAAQIVNQAARLMQIAILQLPQAHDFRRAATFAKQAKNVPLHFRQRQFRRHRHLMVEHFAARLQAGASAENLLPGLTELVTGLGVAGYEADYIRLEAENGNHPQAPASPGYAQQVRQLQMDHEQRLETLRNLPDIAPELQEQLIETEDQRFRDRMLALGNSEGNQTTP